MSRIDHRRLAYWRAIARQGPEEIGYAFFRARRRRRNLADEDPLAVPGEALALDPALDADAALLERGRAIVAGWREAPAPVPIGSVQWFVPWFPRPALGGVHTILRLADHLRERHGAQSRFCLYDRTDPAAAEQVRGLVAGAFPGLAGAPVDVARAGDPAFGHLPDADAAIATTWTSAYRLLRFERTGARFFLVQDHEPAFFPAGSASALLGAVPGFGIPGIVNTPGLAEVYRAAGGTAFAFTPAPDAAYRPPAGPRPERPVRIAFYGRPHTARNAFALGLRTLRLVKERFGEAVDIVAAGEDWNPGAFGAADVLRNAGALPGHEAVADLYRSCHAGLVLMTTAHPSYQPLEWMASGTATVTNDNPHTRWLLRHEDDALLAPAVPSLLAEQVGRLVEDAALRERVVAGGLRTVAALSWETQLDAIWAAMTRRADGAFT